ncbi:hypothetical protein [Actinoalloteichus spitiensis]|uniref:hypothetical protein n=1 Tax=Actinoalloteichus spitiensis TaxID=252394 RepID=UPI000368E2A1|nr:hypothetical protein [Actinoalloteichus spitiensis]
MWEPIDVRWQEVREIQRDRRAEGTWYRARPRPGHRRHTPETLDQTERPGRAAGTGTAALPGSTPWWARGARRARPGAECA